MLQPLPTATIDGEEGSDELGYEEGPGAGGANQRGGVNKRGKDGPAMGRAASLRGAPTPSGAQPPPIISRAASFARGAAGGQGGAPTFTTSSSVQHQQLEPLGPVDDVRALAVVSNATWARTRLFPDLVERYRLQLAGGCELKCVAACGGSG